MTCIRSLQQQAGRIGRQLSDEYARRGRSPRWARLKGNEEAVHDAIEAEHQKGPCRCESCRDEVPW